MTEFAPGEQLCHAYEALRAQATGSDGQPARGLALLLRSGLPSWMQAWKRLVVSPARQLPRPGHCPDTRTPLNPNAELAMLLAQMALARRGPDLTPESAP